MTAWALHGCRCVGTRPKQVILESRHVIFPRFHITYVSFHRLNNKLLEVSKDGSRDNVGTSRCRRWGLQKCRPGNNPRGGSGAG